MVQFCFFSSLKVHIGIETSKSSLICSLMISNNITMSTTVTIIFCFMILLSFTTIRTNNIRSFSKKTSANKCCSTTLTYKTFIMPMTIFKWYITCTTNTYQIENNIFNQKSFILFWFILPVIGLLHAKHFLANSRAKQSPQYGWSSRDVNRWPASEFLQFVHVKHSRCLRNERVYRETCFF